MVLNAGMIRLATLLVVLAAGAVPAELLSMRVWAVLGKMQIEINHNKTEYKSHIQNLSRSSKGHY